MSSIDEAVARVGEAARRVQEAQALAMGMAEELRDGGHVSYPSGAEGVYNVPMLTAAPAAEKTLREFRELMRIP